MHIDSTSTAGGLGSIPGLGTKIWQATLVAFSKLVCPFLGAFGEEFYRSLECNPEIPAFPGEEN